MRHVFSLAAVKSITHAAHQLEECHIVKGATMARSREEVGIALDVG
ncbi:MAG: hypothetical protein ABW130_00610 [Candidatus Thiodiazotropha lotti]